MNAMLELAMILFIALLAGALALTLDWLLLRAAFALMKPAGEARSARVTPAHRASLPGGAQQLAAGR